MCYSECQSVKTTMPSYVTSCPGLLGHNNMHSDAQACCNSVGRRVRSKDAQVTDGLTDIDPKEARQLLLGSFQNT